MATPKQPRAGRIEVLNGGGLLIGRGISGSTSGRTSGDNTPHLALTMAGSDTVGGGGSSLIGVGVEGGL